VGGRKKFTEKHYPVFSVGGCGFALAAMVGERKSRTGEETEIISKQKEGREIRRKGGPREHDRKKGVTR